VAKQDEGETSGDAAIDAEIDLCNSARRYFLGRVLSVSLPGWNAKAPKPS